MVADTWNQKMVLLVFRKTLKSLKLVKKCTGQYFKNYGLSSNSQKQKNPYMNQLRGHYLDLNHLLFAKETSFSSNV